MRPLLALSLLVAVTVSAQVRNTDFRRLVTIVRTPAEQQYAEGVKAAQAKQWDVAAEAFRKAIAFDAKEHAGYFPHYWLGVALDEQHQTSAALSELRESQKEGAVAGTPEAIDLENHIRGHRMTTMIRLPMQPIPLPSTAKTTTAMTVSAPTSTEPTSTAPGPDHHHDLSTPEGRLFEEIDERFRALNPGQMLFHAPDSMKVGEPERVVVRIAAAGQNEGMRSNLPSTGRSDTMTAHVTPVMRVTLAGAGYTITPASPEEQLIGGGTFTEWNWQVTPTESGERELVASAIVTFDGHVKSFPMAHHVHVAPNPMRASAMFLASNWQWLVTTLFIPLAAVVFQQRKKNASA